MLTLKEIISNTLPKKSHTQLALVFRLLGDFYIVCDHFLLWKDFDIFHQASFVVFVFIFC